MPTRLGNFLLILFFFAISTNQAGSSSEGRSLHRFSEAIQPRLSRIAAKETSPWASLASRIEATVRQTDQILIEAEARSRQGLPIDQELELVEAQFGALDFLNIQMEAVFGEIHAKLTAAGLRSKLGRLDAYRTDYRKRIESLRYAIRPPTKSRGGGLERVQQLRAEIARLQPSPEPVARQDSTSMTPEARTYSAQDDSKRPPRVAQDAPTNADLAETPVILITPEIRRLTDQLNRDPAKIFAYVHNNVEYQQYRGYLQNSQAVLWTGRGNGLDQASLLIALMRAAGIPARYVDGNIGLSVEDWMNWWGAKTVAAADSMASAITATVFNDDGSRVAIDHAWVEIFVDDGNGPRWVEVDPSYKVHDYQPGVVLPLIPFDRAGFLSEVRVELASEWYYNQLREHLQANRPGLGLSDLPYKRAIVPLSDTQLPSRLPFNVRFVRERSSTAIEGFHHRLVLTLFGADGEQELARLDLKPAEICLKPMALSFRPATEADAAAIKLFGSLQSTPAFLTDLIPELRIDNEVVASGSTAIGAGEFVRLRTDVFPPFAAESVVAPGVMQPILAGSNAAISLEGVHISNRFISHLVSTLLESETPIDQADPDFVVRRSLYIAATRYNQRVREERARLTERLQFVTQEIYGATVVMRAELERQNLFDRPFLVTHRSMVIGALGSIGTGVNLDIGNARDPEHRRNINRIVSMVGIGLEHHIFEEIFLEPGMSAVKALQLANEKGIPILRFDQSNAAAVIPTLNQYSLFGRGLMQFWIDQGFVIDTPTSPVEFEGSRFVTFFAERADGGIVGEFQSEGAAAQLAPARVKGGGTGSAPSGPTTPPPGTTGTVDDMGGTACPNPVSISNGNMFHQFVDAVIPVLGPPIFLQRTYNSQSDEIGPFGYGWTHNYNLSLRVEGDVAVYTNESGGQEVLNRQGDQFASSLIRGLLLRQEGAEFVLRLRDGEEQRFNAAGRIVGWSDRNRNGLLFNYDGMGSLTSITGAQGRSLTLSYDGRGRVTSLRDFTGRAWSYLYDDADNLIESRDESGNATTYSYYSSSFNDHNLRTITDPEGNELTFVYYADDKTFKTINKEGGERLYFYLPFRNETQTVDERGFRTSFVYDEQGRVIQTTLPDGNILSQAWSPAGLPMSRTGEIGLSARFEYDSRGNLIRERDPFGAVTELTYEPTFQRPLTIRDAQGNRSRFEYDSRGNQTKRIDARGAEEVRTYDQLGRLVSIVDAEGAETKFRYGAGRVPQEIIEPLGNRTTTDYDELDRPIRFVGPSGAETRISYGAFDRMTSLTNTAGATSTFEYDRLGRLVKATDPKGGVLSYSYDGLNNLTSVRDAAGGTARYGYSTANCFCAADSRLTTLEDPAGAILKQQFTFRGRPSLTTNAMGQTTRLSFDASGNVERTNRPNGQSLQLEYDALNRITARVGSDGSRDEFTYDSVGNLASASNRHVRYAFTYDEVKQLTTVQDSRFPSPIRYEYDRVGRRTRMTDHAGGATTYEYDAAGRLISLTNPSGLTTRLSYGPTGQRSEVIHFNGIRATYAYDQGGRILSITHTDSAGTPIDRQEYGYDVIGNRVSRTDNAGAHSYSYDSLHRLLRATHSNQEDEIYEYDAGGNRVSERGQSGFVFDTVGRLLRTPADRFAYDANGNLISRVQVSNVRAIPSRARAQGGYSYRYDASDRLVSVSLGGRVVGEYAYGPLGRRIQKTANGVTRRYSYDSANILGEYDEQSRRVARYTFAKGVDRPLIMQRDINSNSALDPDESFSYLTDALGSVVALAGSNGDVRARYEYDAFGNVTPDRSSIENPFRFTAREWDRESGLYFYRLRYYDPTLGRFTQPDLVRDLMQPASLNLYVYVSNNPATLVDPLGLQQSGIREATAEESAQFYIEQTQGSAASAISSQLLDSRSTLHDPSDLGVESLAGVSGNVASLSNLVNEVSKLDVNRLSVEERRALELSLELIRHKGLEALQDVQQELAAELDAYNTPFIGGLLGDEQRINRLSELEGLLQALVRGASSCLAGKSGR